MKAKNRYLLRTRSIRRVLGLQRFLNLQKDSIPQITYYLYQCLGKISYNDLAYDKIYIQGRIKGCKDNFLNFMELWMAD